MPSNHVLRWMLPVSVSMVLFAGACPSESSDGDSAQHGDGGAQGAGGESGSASTRDDDPAGSSSTNADGGTAAALDAGLGSDARGDAGDADNPDGSGGTGGRSELTPWPVGDGCWTERNLNLTGDCANDEYRCPAPRNFHGKQIGCSDGSFYEWGCAAAGGECNCGCFVDGEAVTSCIQDLELHECPGGAVAATEQCTQTFSAEACGFPADVIAATGPKECCFDAECPSSLPHCNAGSCSRTAPATPFACECREDADCGDDELCGGHTCFGHPYCRSDEDCTSDELCVFSECRKACSEHADCGVNIECLKDGSCSTNPRPCGTDIDCAAGYACEERASPCTPSSVSCACAPE